VIGVDAGTGTNPCHAASRSCLWYGHRGVAI
jgi:hypothetical protein